jgi:hypothetical protein
MMKREDRKTVKAGNHHANSNTGQEPRENENPNRHVYIEPGVQVDFVQDLKNRYKNSQSDNTAHNKKQLFWTKIAAGLVLIYTAFAGWQGCSTQSILSHSVEQFRIEERPWLTADPTPMLDKDAANGLFFLPRQTPNGTEYEPNIIIRAYNGGKTPAVDMLTAPYEFKVGPTNQIIEEVKKFVPTYPEKYAGGFMGTSGNPIILPVKDWENYFPQDVIDRINNGTWAMFIVGGVRYHDVFDPKSSPYETIYCFQVHRKGIPIATCPFTNEIK